MCSQTKADPDVSHPVHIIRLVETKLDTLIDSALLDYESADEPPVRFDDEWASSTFFRNLTSGSKNSKRPPHAATIFESGGVGSPKAATKGPAEMSSSGSSMDSPTKTLRRPRSIMYLGTSVADSLRAALFEDTVSPSNIISTLSSTLLVLQIYSVNPAFIFQIFSQVFVWLAAETFNRIMSSVSGKRYQCRSKAMQIRLNLEAVAEWVRAQCMLPGDLFRKQFQRVNQLLQVSSRRLDHRCDRLYSKPCSQWLQCSSQITDLHVMVSTIQHLPDVTPLQLQRAVRDYRYEVGESRISQACMQHLGQLQRDWEHRRVKTSIDKIQREVEVRRSYRRHASAAYSDNDAEEDDTFQTPNVNMIFDATVNLAQYTLPLPPQSSSEFEDSRYMLPLAVPRNTLLPAFLVAPLAVTAPGTPPDASNPILRPVSSAGASFNQPLQYNVRGSSQLRRLPDDFVEWLRSSDAQEVGSARLLRSGLVSSGIEDTEQRIPQSVSITVATPERLPRKRSTVDPASSRKDQSPVTPVFAHYALGMAAGSQIDSLDHPIRLRQLSSGSNGSLHRDLNLRMEDSNIPLSDTSSAYVATGPDSPLRNRTARNGSALGSLTHKFWSPRARQPSDASQDGYIDSSDEDQDVRQ